jgi:IclR family pca regulon transcriptional regulator
MPAGKQMPLRKQTSTEAAVGRRAAAIGKRATTPARRAGEELGAGSAGRYSSSLVAGLAILDRFTSERPEFGIAALAGELNMSRSTTHRYASTLVALGYLEQDYSRRYRLAPRVADLGLALLDSMALRRAGAEHLRRLRKQTGRTVSLGILDGPEIMYLEALRGWRRGQYAINLDIGIGVHLPSHCTSIGKTLLAHLPEHRREPLIGKLTLARRGPNTITDRGDLRAELERVRADGLAISDEELAPGLRTIAAPVPDGRGEVPAAVAISVPSEAFARTELIVVLGPLVAETAQRIAADLADC